MELTKTRETMFKFNTWGAAASFKDHSTQACIIVLGDDDLFWMVTPSHASRLLKQGYELAE